MILFIVFAYFLLYALAFSLPPLPWAHIILHGQQPLQKIEGDLSLDAWLEREEKIALQKLLANIAPGGANVPDAVPGVVVASPSKQRPDYYYQWTRDAAITTGELAQIYVSDPSSELSANLSTILEAYASLSHKLQHTDTPSGTFGDLSGLGEPKFYVDGRPYRGSWGRPQHDGPALRALTLMAYLRAYNASHPSLWSSNEPDQILDGYYQVSMPANSTIKADLEYVSHYWQRPGFDVWEEVRGLHFFTAMAQLRSLREGVDVATAFGDTGAASWYAEQAKMMETLIPQFWDDRKGHLVATLNGQRMGLDCSLLLGSIHGTVDSESPSYAFPPWSDEVLVSMLALIKDQRHRFPINAAPPPSLEGVTDALEGVGVGRYPEDGYDGYEFKPASGNPWFLCTSSVAEILYRTSTHLSTIGNLTVTERGLPFWKALVDPVLPPGKSIKAGRTYSSHDPEFQNATRRLKSTGDGFLKVVKTHTDAEGRLSEQFDRVTGFERGASDLTWSYGAFLQAVRARKKA